MYINHYYYVQVYQLLLYHVGHADHNVITASLETLQQLLKQGPPSLLQTLIASDSTMLSCIYASELPTKHTESSTGKTDNWKLILFQLKKNMFSFCCTHRFPATICK